MPGTISRNTFIFKNHYLQKLKIMPLMALQSRRDGGVQVNDFPLYGVQVNGFPSRLDLALSVYFRTL